ncbi:DUF421 domain-containing protein [Croceicoccus sp. YJ47]|uniref:DUF421 domain-containing protein n=1 Tax=Croceicoccus sp. YJ47 TaxID=2798724 RepID=UPI0019216F25|nr:YetF domain-containing protein [Croceicoccus sp. YJ47]QQN73824.1 DUF421 domain-containing protein [Croceicoccus sp. YJ47]
MFFDSWAQVFRVLAMVGASYALIIVILRVAGKRSLSKLNAFDFVVTIALGSILASTILLKDISLSEGVAALLGLAALQMMVTWFSNRSHRFAKALRSEPRLLLSDGKFHDEALRNERITQGEVEAAIRKHGEGKIANVSAVVLESDGSLSVICQGPSRDFTALRSVLGPEETSL